MRIWKILKKHLNEFYNTRLVLTVRILSAIVTLWLIGSDLFESNLGVHKTFSYNLSSWIPALIAAWHIHKPEPELA